MSLTEYAAIHYDMKSLKVDLNDVGAPDEGRYQHATHSTRPCIIDDLPGCAVAANVLHVSEQVHEERI